MLSPKHESISLLLIDPRSEGRRSSTPTLARHTLGANEVYLSEVVPQENRADLQDAGWPGCRP